MIDWQRVSVLRNEVGPDDFDEIVTLFTEEVEEVATRLQQGYDPASLEADMHFLKGSALSFGFTEFAQMCQNGETLAAQGRYDDVEIAPILNCYQASRTQFLLEIPDAFAC